MVTEGTSMVALYPPPEMIRAVSGLCDTRMDLHLTLVPLGEVERSMVPEYSRAILDATVRMRPIELKVEGASCFYLSDDLRATTLLINSHGLDDWRYEILQEMRRRGLGFLDTYGFSPHVTLSYGEDFGLLRELWSRSSWPTWKCNKVILARGLSLRLPFLVSS
jgi:2'-5' RNA ligase